jgi:cell division protein FtsQ
MKRLLLFLILIVAVGGWLLGWSPYLRVQEVKVSGLSSTSPLTVDRVLEQAGVHEGMPLARVSEPAIRRSLERIARIRDVDVARRWPHAVEIRVMERVPWAVATIGGERLLVDRQGVFFPGRATPELPGIALTTRDARVVRDLVLLHDAMPRAMQRSVTRYTAASSIALTSELVAAGRSIVVTWGDSSELDLKVRVLRSLLARPDADTWKRVDLSAPRAPTTSD